MCQLAKRVFESFVPSMQGVQDVCIFSLRTLTDWPSCEFIKVYLRRLCLYCKDGGGSE